MRLSQVSLPNNNKKPFSPTTMRTKMSCQLSAKTYLTLLKISQTSLTQDRIEDEASRVSERRRRKHNCFINQIVCVD